MASHDDVKAFEYRDGALRILDQRHLPREEVWIDCVDYRMVADAIRTLAVRGAPAIGIAAAYGVVLASRSESQPLGDAIRELAATRPTAVNLFWALARMQRVVDTHAALTPVELERVLEAEATHMEQEDTEASRLMAAQGAVLIPDGAGVLTHCNTGALVAGSPGTALGAIRAAHEQGKQIHVWVDETRPLLQGARLTTWELQRLHIPFTLITDNMAAHFMARGQINVAMVGADRIAANGDTANKIGTYGVAVLARAHGIPFYVVAPTSSIDASISSGDAITIEERRPEEVTHVAGVAAAPAGIQVANPAFDVTPAGLINAIVTEAGVAQHPLGESLRRHVGGVEPQAMPDGT